MFVLICTDKPDHLEVRKANRDAHLAYTETVDFIYTGGPMLDENGDMCGSLIVLDVETRAEAEAFAAGDPYAAAGLFASVEIKGWKKVLGK